MIKCEAVKDFRIERFDELENIVRKNVEVKGKIFEGDTFECSENMAEYLTGNNPLSEVVAKIIEVIPSDDEKFKNLEWINEEDAKDEENASNEKITRKKTSKKSKE